MGVGAGGAPPAGLAPRFLSRLERFERVTSTQDVVRAWLDDGLAEVCVAVADVQTTGRGRLERRWQAGAGLALLVSAGFRPPDLLPGQAWRLPAVASLAMLDAARSLMGAPADRLALKWPNDIVAIHGGQVRKVGGVLAQTMLQGNGLAGAVVGLGVNVDWPAEEFPSDLAASMWSLREASGGRHVERDALLAAWLVRLEALYGSLARGHFDSRRWADAQVSTGAEVEVDTGSTTVRGTGLGVDPDTGALLLRTSVEAAPRSVDHGEVVRCRVDRPARHG